MSKSTSTSMAAAAAAESEESRVAKFERFINDVLKESLRHIFAALETVNEEIMDLDRSHDTIGKMAALADQLPAGRPFKTRVNVGCDFYMQADADVRTYVVCVGLGYYVEYTKDEALAYIRRRTDQLKRHADELRDKGARVRAQITLALHCVEHEQGL